MQIIGENNPITKISLITNTDGIHTESDTIHFVQEEPIVILTKLIGSHYISQYNKKSLYPMNIVGFDYSLAIDYVGDYYDPATLVPFKPFLSIDDFIMFARNEINKAKFKYDDEELSKKTEDEKIAIELGAKDYFDSLGKVKENDPCIQFAIDHHDALNSLLCVDEDQVSKYISIIDMYVNRQLSLHDGESVKLIRYMYRTAYSRIL